MLKCISYWSLEHGLANTHPIDRALREVTAAGFDGLELCIGPEGVVHTELAQAQCEAIRAQAEDAGVIIQTLASGMSWGFNPVSNDPAVRTKAVELHTKALQRAAWLGCSAMLFVPGVVCSPISPDERVRYDLAVDRAREAVARLLDTAERVGIDLCLENVWNGLFYSPLELRDFIDSFHSDRLGVYFDVGNVLGYQQYPPHWIELLGSRIKRIHIKDFKETFGWNGSYSFCELLEGDVPFEPSIQALYEIGYDATIVAEIMPHTPGLLDRTSTAMDTILGYAEAKKEAIR